MIPEMIFLLPCKLFSTFMWPFFCLWYRVLSKTDLYSWSVPFCDPFIWLLIRRTSALDKQLVPVPKVPLRNSLLVPDDFTSVNRVLLFLFFCTGEAVLNLVRGSFYTWMIIRYLMSNERRMYILYAFLNLTRLIVSTSSLHLTFDN